MHCILSAPLFWPSIVTHTNHYDQLFSGSLECRSLFFGLSCWLQVSHFYSFYINATFSPHSVEMKQQNKTTNKELQNLAVCFYTFDILVGTRFDSRMTSSSKARDYGISLASSSHFVGMRIISLKLS